MRCPECEKGYVKELSLRLDVMLSEDGSAGDISIDLGSPVYLKCSKGCDFPIDDISIGEKYEEIYQRISDGSLLCEGWVKPVESQKII